MVHEGNSTQTTRCRCTVGRGSVASVVLGWVAHIALTEVLRLDTSSDSLLTADGKDDNWRGNFVFVNRVPDINIQPPAPPASNTQTAVGTAH
ncbi:hypothetical protein Hypma_001352 [Hypsizygus marmoreus]|uniref:Uncharacterized protein n=1 Tax=Hypsizygus marmoreus TaxID=39966 RepID=A0A369K697_HYPMA|nr:hypothetical protein Hypma_001352 [Hypsizygus marmoreus]